MPAAIEVLPTDFLTEETGLIVNPVEAIAELEIATTIEDDQILASIFPI